MLLYVNEHISCNKYLSPSESIFHPVNEHTPGIIQECNSNKKYFCFILSGEVTAIHSKGKTGIRQNEFAVFDGDSLKLSSETEFKGIVCRTHLSISTLKLCPKHFFSELSQSEKMRCIESIQNKTFPIRPRLATFLHLLYDCLSDGLNCKHYHSNKLEEMLFLLRGYYSREELIQLFRPLLDGQTESFKEKIYNKPEYIHSVSSLASYLNMSESALSKRFNKEFGMAPQKWLNREKANLILREIQQTDKSFEEISLDYEMSSPAYLTYFCKKQLGKTPTELRRKEHPSEHSRKKR